MNVKNDVDAVWLLVDSKLSIWHSDTAVIVFSLLQSSLLFVSNDNSCSSGYVKKNF